MKTERSSKFLIIAVGAVSLAACQVAPPLRPPEPELRLLHAPPLDLPSGCVASGSFVVSFTVAPTGRTSGIRTDDAPRCVQEALTAWVEAFQYAPPARATPTAVEWMMVAGKRGS